MDIQARHLSTHLLHSHNIYHDASAAGSVAILLGRAPPHYTISMPRSDMHVTCPVDSCPAHVSDWFGLRRHFMFRHPTSTLIILEEGLLPKCEFCRMHIPLASVGTHSLTALCHQGLALDRKRLYFKRIDMPEKLSSLCVLFLLSRFPPFLIWDVLLPITVMIGQHSIRI